MGGRAFQTSETCGNCGRLIALNAYLTKTIRCPDCDVEHRVGTAWARAGDVILTAPVEPRCPGCSKELTLPKPLASFECSGCNGHVHVRPMPDHVFGEFATHLIGEDASQLDDVDAATGQRAEEHGMTTTTVACQQCGGQLSLAGRNRKVTCTFCHTDNMLSDEVWRRMHPASVSRPFYVWIDDDAATAAAQAKAEASRLRELQGAPGCLVTTLALVAIGSIGTCYGVHEVVREFGKPPESENSLPYFVAAFVGGVVAYIALAFMSAQIRILARGNRAEFRDGADITLLSVGVVLVIVALVLRFAMHMPWETLIVVGVIGAGLAGGTIQSALKD